MQDEESSLIGLITEEWASLSEEYKPDGVWIRKYSFMPPDVDMIADQIMFPQKVWFLDDNGLRVENVWKWRRFITIRSGQFWDGRIWGEPNIVSANHYKIGVAGFAPYLELGKFYVEMQWAGTLGGGWQMIIDKQGTAQRTHRIWVS